MTTQTNLEEQPVNPIERDFQAFISGPLFSGNGFTHVTSDGSIPGALDLVRRKGTERIIRSGSSSISAFQIAFDQLVTDRAIVRQETEKDEPEAKPFTLTVEEYRSIPASTIVLKYQRQPEFKAAVDSLIARGLI